MTPELKGYLINFLKTYKYNNRKTKVCVVGINQKDNLMVTLADCGI